MAERLAESMGRLGTETAFEVRARAKALEASGRRVIHLEIGEPDFGTPEHIVEAGMRALRDGHTHYCPAPGLPELREACAAHLSAHRGIAVDAGRVVVAPGAKPFLFFGVLATCQPGDEVVYPNPGFPIYESVIRFVGATPVPLPLVEERGFAFTADDLAERLSPRSAVVDGLNALPGVSCVMPHGAFYAFPNITGTGMEARAVADRLLQEAGVAVLSGTAFGAYGEGYLRLSYANSLENIA